MQKKREAKMTSANSNPHDQVFEAIVYLSDQCDGAIDVDGKGFNKFDEANGHRMAAIIRNGGSLSMLDYQRALGFVTKYKKQLSDRPEAITINKVNSVNREGLNEQQGAAFDGIIDWFGDRNGSRQSLLVGYAGTGKTYNVQRIAKEIQQVHKARICFTAFTHKACQVLSKMADEAGLNVEVRTICSLLGLIVEYDKFGKGKIKQKSDDKSYQYDFVVIDEGSMVGHKLNEFVEDMQARYLVMGDPCQLPDVETGLESPVFTTIKDKWELTKVVRYDGAIYKYVTDIRENIVEKKLPFHKYEIGAFDKFTEDKWLNNVIEYYKKAIQNEDSDPNAIRALSWSNARVQAINNTVRNALYGDHALPYIVGERLVAKDMIEVKHPDGDWQSGALWNTGSNTVLMYSCDECVINAVKRGIKTVFGASFEGWLLDITTDLGDDATVFTPDVEEKNRILAICGMQKKAILDTHFEDRKRPQMWAIFYKGLNELGLKMANEAFMRKLQYVFCITIHQSQGSTFKTVFADVSNVFGCQDIELRNKLLYVQGSRASEELYLLNNF